MDKGLLHTPEGVRDIYNGECLRKLNLEDRIWKTFRHYGYRPIQTPTFELFDIFNKERGSVPSRHMYKFFDREGNTLVLRPDMTPAVARSAAKYYMDETMPIRLCYKGNTYRNNSEHQGKLKETTQIGCELIGDDSADADAELLAMAIESLLSAGISDRSGTGGFLPRLTGRSRRFRRNGRSAAGSDRTEELFRRRAASGAAAASTPSGRDPFKDAETVWQH